MIVALAFVAAAIVAYAAYRARALSLSGACAAWIVGGTTFAIGGWQCALVLFAFFVPSTALSRIGRARKRLLVDVGKSGPRDAWQVLANGGVATLSLLASLRFGPIALVAFAGAFAAASADTWSTEIGTLARGAPRSILTFRSIPTGLSGGVTWQGTLAQIGGAACVAAAAAALHVAAFVPVVLAGIAGSLVDSLLGAGAQSLRYCPQCERACETDPHACGTPTILRRGFGWLQNDAVNLAATISGACVAWWLHAL